jgi:hypothetical protein
MDNAIQVRNIFVPWSYNLIASQIPEDGELVCVKGAPNFTGQNRTVMGDGVHNVAWLIAQLVVTPSDLQQEILAEQAARIAADNVLQGNIDDEETARAEGDTNVITLTLSAINNESQARIAGDANVLSSAQTLIDGEAQTRLAKDNQLQAAIALSNQAITAEETARIAMDNAHAALTAPHSATSNPTANRIAMYDSAGRLKSGASPSGATDVVRKAELDTEKAQRFAAEDALQQDIKDEETARIAAVSAEAQARTAAVNAEAQARSATDTTLGGSINAEIQVRTAAVNAEAQARSAADTALQGDIDAEETARIAAVNQEAQTRAEKDADEVTIRQGQFNSLSINKQDKKPDGTNNLIGSDGKINPIYMSGSILSGMIYGGTFNGSGIISASSYAPALQGVRIDTVNTANYPGFFFIAQSPYIFGGTSYASGDWAISQGAHTPQWVKIDNSNAVSNVNGKTGAVILTKGDVGLGNVDNTSDLNKPMSTAQQAAVSAEAQARSAAVNQEAQTRSAKDNALQGNIDLEKAQRFAADAALQGDIDAEETARIAMGTALGGNISAEETARIAAVNAEIQARTAADTALQGDIDDEETARKNADKGLQDQIDDIDDELGGLPDVYAPIDSPHFTGVPTTPEPDYTVPEQVADVRAILNLRDLILATALRDSRITWGESALMPRLRATRNRDRIRAAYPA